MTQDQLAGKCGLSVRAIRQLKTPIDVRIRMPSAVHAKGVFKTAPSSPTKYVPAVLTRARRDQDTGGGDDRGAHDSVPLGGAVPQGGKALLHDAAGAVSDAFVAGP
jgi:hypothetical protein